MMKQVVHILDSAQMPCEGFYRLKRITAEKFADLVSPSFQENQVYAYSIELLYFAEKLTGIKVQLRKEPPEELSDGDKLLVVKQKQSKGRFEFYAADYVHTAPVVPYSNLVNLDIYESRVQQAIDALYILTGGRNLDAIKYTLKLMKELDDSDDERWYELHRDYLKLLQMHFDPEGYNKEVEH